MEIQDAEVMVNHHDNDHDMDNDSEYYSDNDARWSSLIDYNYRRISMMTNLKHRNDKTSMNLG